MVPRPLHQTLPSTAELPCSDDTPVDNADEIAATGRASTGGAAGCLGAIARD